MNKKLLFLILLPIVGLVSCVAGGDRDNDTNPIEVGKEPIIFATAVNSTTKAAPIMDEFLPAGSEFGVYAYIADTGVSYFENFKAIIIVNTDDDFVAYSDRYWPASKAYSLSFFSYYPYSTSSAPTFTKDTKTLSFDYEVPKAYTDHVDLLVASSVGVLHGNKVAIEFQHALTLLTFEAQKQNGMNDFSVKRITIDKIKREGTLTVKEGADNSWSYSSSTNDSYTTGVINKLIDKKESDSSYSPIVSTAGPAFMVLPVGSDFGDAELKIEIYDGVDDSNTVTYTKKLSEIHSGNGWMAGEHINYQILIKGKDIEITWVSVAGWGDPTNEEVPLE